MFALRERLFLGCYRTPKGWDGSGEGSCGGIYGDPGGGALPTLRGAVGCRVYIDTVGLYRYSRAVSIHG